MRMVVKSLPDSGYVVDIGCGYGRWFSMTRNGRRLIGMDFSTALVRSAALRKDSVPIIRADVRHPPFPPNTLAAAYTVKVLQFLPQEERSKAIAELLSAMAPGGRLVIFEKTTGSDGSPPYDWIQWGSQGRGRLLSSRGNQFVPLDRLLVALARKATDSDPGQQASHDSRYRGRVQFRHRHAGWYVIYTRIRQFVLWLSLPIEPLFERLAPLQWAEHGIFVFEKV